MLRAFVSSTSSEFLDFHDVANQAVEEGGWEPVARDVSTYRTPGALVEQHQRCIVESNLFLLLLSFQRGQIPSVDQGGDGVHSLAELELLTAERAGTPIRVLIATGTLPAKAIWKTDKESRDAMKKWRDDLKLGDDWKHPTKKIRASGYFTGDRNQAALVLAEFRQLVRQSLTEQASAFKSAAEAKLILDPRMALNALLAPLGRIIAEIAVPQHPIRRAFEKLRYSSLDPLPEVSDSFSLMMEAVCRLLRVKGEEEGYALLEFIDRLVDWKWSDSVPRITDGELAQLSHWLDDAKHLLAVVPPPQRNVVPNVFISANSRDHLTASSIAEHLENHEIRVYYWQHAKSQQPDSQFQEEISRAIEDAQHMIVVASTVDNIEAPWVKAEWRAFIRKIRRQEKMNNRTSNLLTILCGTLRSDDMPLELSEFDKLSLDPEKLDTLLPYFRPGQ